ncbi:hypothetical protein F4824DRAFT_516294 [Ustulina deusta]|nr:hypothetical protein F4824DRAFT_516294 [Ustulina deusta]
MASSFDEALTEYASSIIEQLDLQEDDIIKLIEVLEADENSPEESATNVALSFGKLVDILSSPKNPMPEYLTKDESALAVYTDEQMDLIVALIQARYWFAEVDRLSEYFWHWGRIFSVPRQAHREANGVVVQNVGAVARLGSPNTWVNLLPRGALDCAGPWYDALKKKYFPRGIDDAIPGFMRHYVSLQDSLTALRGTLIELRKRWVRVQPWWQGQTHEALQRLSRECDRLTRMEPLLARNIDLARKWFRESANRLERAQLPGDIFGLRYGKYVTVNYFSGEVMEKVPTDEGKLFWKMTDARFNPIRMRPNRPGSPWCDWFANQRRPDYKTSLMGDHFPELSEPRDSADQNSPEPIKILLPHAVLDIARHFDTIFDFERGRLATIAGGQPEVELSSKEHERRAKAISKATGEPYWRVRCYENYQETHELGYAQNPALKYRPIYDGAGNIRLDYMDAILHEITYGVQPADYRSVFEVIVLETPSSTSSSDSSPDS